jgi:hypothetical protein
MALLQALNSDASMATGDDLMEFSTEGRSPMIEDDIDIDADGGAPLQDQDMVEGGAGEGLIDDEMADGDGGANDQPTITVTGDEGHDLDIGDVEHHRDEASSGHEPGGPNKPEAESTADVHGDTAAPVTDAEVAQEPGTTEEAGGQGEQDGENEDNVAAEDHAEESDEESPPPPRRPAGKGPAGRAPQKTPAFSTATAEDPPETTSHDSGEESQDEDNEQNAANPTTTEPSFTESAKNESESEDESEEGEPAAPPAKQPTYHESLSESDSESLVDNGPVHSIIVDYQGSKISLFPPQPDHEEQESYLLQDEGLCHEPIARMLNECRHVLRETLLEDEELLLTIPCLGVSISEQIAETMSTTMTELVDLFLQLSYNDGVDAPAALRVTLDTKEKCHARIDLIRRMIGEGKGLSHVLAHLDGSAAAAAAPPIPSKPAAHDDFGTGHDELSQVGDQLEPSVGTADAFVPSEPQDFEEQFDVQTPGGDEADPLGGAGGENDPDFLDFTSPEKMGKATVAKDTSNFDDVFDGDFGSANNLIDVPAGGDGLDLQGGQAGLGEFGGELGGADFVDTFDATNDGEGAGSGAQTQMPLGASNDIGGGGHDAPASNEYTAQAAEDEFTFIDTSGDGGDDTVVAVGQGDGDGGIGLVDDLGSGSPVGTKRTRSDDDEAALLEDAAPASECNPKPRNGDRTNVSR